MFPRRVQKSKMEISDYETVKILRGADHTEASEFWSHIDRTHVYLFKVFPKAKEGDMRLGMS